jgi:integration host factor subunit beta
MIRSEFISHLAKNYPRLYSKDAKKIVHLILEALSNTLSKGGRVEIRGFGSFELKYRPSCQRRNPKTGDKVKVTAKNVLHFKVGKELRMRVREEKSLL